MKKFMIGLMTVVAATMFAACGSKASTETTDEVAVDSVEVVTDTVAVDTLAVETVEAVDTVVAE